MQIKCLLNADPLRLSARTVRTHGYERGAVDKDVGGRKHTLARALGLAAQKKSWHALGTATGFNPALSGTTELECTVDPQQHQTTAKKNSPHSVQRKVGAMAARNDLHTVFCAECTM